MAEMDPIEGLCAASPQGSLSADKEKSHGYKSIVGFFCLFPLVALLAAVGDPFGVAAQRSQVGTGPNSQRLDVGDQTAEPAGLCLCVCVSVCLESLSCHVRP